MCDSLLQLRKLTILQHSLGQLYQVANFREETLHLVTSKEKISIIQYYQTEPFQTEYFWAEPFWFKINKTELFRVRDLIGRTISVSYKPVHKLTRFRIGTQNFLKFCSCTTEPTGFSFVSRRSFQGSVEK